MKVGDILKYRDDFGITRLVGKKVRIVKIESEDKIWIWVFDTQEKRSSSMKYLETIVQMNRNGANS